MANRPTITTLSSGAKYNTATLNSNFTALRDAFDNLLGRLGTSGSNNAATGDLDLDGNTLRNATFDGTVIGVDWKGAWVTATAFAVNDLVSESGNVYICVIAHTSGTFATDLAAAKWELFASKGDSGAGTGDMLAANNLSDVASAATSRSNLDVIEDVFTTRGDIVYRNATVPARLAVGATSGHVLTSDATDPSWAEVPLPRSYLAGFGTVQAVDTDHDITIAAGAGRDNSGSKNIELSSAITKQIDAAWAVGSGAGGLDTGTVTNDVWYYVWVIKRTDTGVVDALFSTSSSSPTMPTNYDVKRRVAAVLTDASSNIIDYIQVGDWFWWKDPPLDINVASPGTSAQTATLSTPTIATTAFLNVVSPGASALYLSPLDINDEAPSTSAAPLGVTNVTGSVDAAGPVFVRTNASSQIRWRVSASGQTSGATLGWIDTRGKDD